MQNYDKSFALIQDRFLNGEIADNGLQDQKTSPMHSSTSPFPMRIWKY